VFKARLDGTLSNLV